MGETAETAGRVLLVDDMPQVRELGSLVLEAAGYEVATAADGAEALDLINTQQFDVIAVDLGLPDMDGQAVANRIRESQLNAAAVVLAITGDAVTAGRPDFVGELFNGSILKPFMAEDLVEQIRAAHATEA